MRTDTTIIPAQEAAYLLRLKLGPIRAWSDFLADCIRGRASLRGLTLTPCLRIKNGGTFRPMYALEDVEAFIAEVLKTEPSAGPTAIKANTLSVDRRQHWRLNKFDQQGTMLRRIEAHSRMRATAH